MSISAPFFAPQIYNYSIFVGFYLEKCKVNDFQLTLPRPIALPESCTSTISYLDRNSDTKLFPPFSNIFPKAHPKGIPHPSSSPTPFISSNFPKMIFLCNLSHSKENLHNHLPSKTWLRPSNLLNPRPPCFLSLHTYGQFTKWIFLLPPVSSYKKSLWNLSNLNLIFLNIAKRDIKYIGRFDRVFLIRTSLPPLKRYCFF